MDDEMIVNGLIWLRVTRLEELRWYRKNKPEWLRRINGVMYVFA